MLKIVGILVDVANDEHGYFKWYSADIGPLQKTEVRIPHSIPRAWEQ